MRVDEWSYINQIRTVRDTELFNEGHALILDLLRMEMSVSVEEINLES